MSKKKQFFRGVTGGGFDADAQNLITAANIVDTLEQNAINTFFVALKDASLYDKILAGYLCVGDSYESMKYNFKNPLDTNEAFRLTSNGVVSYSNLGVKGNGSNGYLETHFNALNNLNIASNHFTYYINENIQNDAFIGLGAGNATIQLYPRGAFFGNQTHYASGNTNGQNNQGNIVVSGVTDSKGFHMINRELQTSFKAIKNGAVLATRTHTLAQLSNSDFYLSARNLNGSSASNFDTRQWCYASLGLGMTDAEALTYYNIIQDFQIFKNRQA